MHPGIGGGPPASPQQFCLRWNNYQSNLTNVFDQLLQSESFVDVTLACEGHSVKAHKMVLSACSPYFQSLFFDNPCQHPIVILKDIKWPELKAVVEFMYKGEINVSQEQIGPLLKVAESLKIRGLADVNGEQDLGKGLEDVSLSRKKRRRTSVDPSSPEGSVSESLEGRALELVTTSPPSSCPPPAGPPSSTPTNMLPLPLAPPPPPPPVQPPQQPSEDMEIKPGIAEMIREEERVAEDLKRQWSSWGASMQDKAKMLESSHAWLGASTSSLAADSYQYQLQSMWQKCWNTNQSLVHNLRFRERGPLKSWRPETMAEAILSVLKEGLSLSQAARKYDIPYPTFVLYANRVHNMLGPSADGGSDLRPKGRGRPQRILLGIWPEEHIRGVIRAVVFRDPQHMKDDTMNLGYHRLQQEVAHNYSNSGGGSGGGSGPGSVAGSDSVSAGGVSPNSAAAAVVAVAQNLRQQMLAAAAQQHHHHHHQNHAQHHPTAQEHQQPSHLHNRSPNFGFFAAAAAHCANGNNLVLHSPSPVDSSPRSSPLTQPNNNMEMALNMGFKPMVNDLSSAPRNEHMFQEEIEDLVKRPQSSETPKMKPPLMPYKLQNTSMPNDLSTRADHMFQEEMENMMKHPPVSEAAKVKVGIGVSNVSLPFKGQCESYGPPRTESLFQDDIEDLVKSPPSNAKKEPIQMSIDMTTNVSE
ncbi:protein bric-a-brac 2-like isoform X3 [Cimex lectularius]|uniref:Protein bric-a-brac 1 n=1 Tax=Cimex lectularius TaxID=79782 RepID=A0A8I6S8J1_CIMLE|nr:protein bric-a-brac 2-like isoform X3 [Cimex lectularius]